MASHGFIFLSQQDLCAADINKYLFRIFYVLGNLGRCEAKMDEFCSLHDRNIFFWETNKSLPESLAFRHQNSLSPVEFKAATLGSSKTGRLIEVP